MISTPNQQTEFSVLLVISALPCLASLDLPGGRNISKAANMID